MHDERPMNTPPLSTASLPPYSFTNVWGLGWSRWRTSFLPLFLGTLILAAVNVPMQLQSLANIPAVIVNTKASESAEAAERLKAASAAASGISGIFGCFAGIWGIFVALPILAGFVWMGVQAARGVVPEVGSILQGYRRFPTVLGGLVLSAIILLVPYLLAISVALPLLLSQSDWDINQLGQLMRTQDTWDGGFIAALIIAAVWIAVCVVVIYWIGIRLMMWLPIAVDEVGPRRGAWASINRSWHITRGSALSLFGLLFTASLMAAFTVVLCCVPYFVVGLPLYITLFGLAYAMLSQQETARDAAASPAQ
ncbi:MAG: hypothetical protein ACKO4V_05285 [Planctomycetota bacterium]